MLITQDDGIHLFKTAGYTIKIPASGKTFSLWEGGRKIRAYSNKDLLGNVAFVITEIKSISFSKGVRVGKTTIKEELKTLLDRHY